MADSGGMTLDLVQCSSGYGDQGKLLAKEISSIVGKKVTIKLYDKNVGWSGGHPLVTNVLSDFLRWLLGYEDKPTEIKKAP